MPKFTIAEIAARTDDFKTFLSVLMMSGLAEKYSEDIGGSDYTVFVPGEDAFKLLPKGIMKSIMSSRKNLESVIKNHVVKGKFYALDLEDMDELESVDGQHIRLAEKDGVIFVNNAKITSEDIEAKDGIIHIIDEVMLPDSIEI